MAVKDENREEKSHYNVNDSAFNRWLSKQKSLWNRTSKFAKVVLYVLLVVGLILPLIFISFPYNFGAAVFIDFLVLYFSRDVFNSLYPAIQHSRKEERNGLEIDTTGAAGTANAAEESEDEMNDIFSSADYYRQLQNICGIDPRDPRKLLSVRRNRGMNGNVIIFGSPGSGKSVGVAIPTVMQTIRRGESLIVTDPKGELYEKTSAMARANGYTVKILNLSPKMMAHSDGCNFMSVIKGDDLKAASFAETVIQNTMGGTKPEFFDYSETNLLQALLLLHTQEASMYEATLPAVYKHLVQSKAEDLAMEFDDLDWDSPAMGPGGVFSGQKDSVQGDTRAGLAIKLRTLNNRILQAVSGTDDIDFTLPGREKCIYYIVSDDTDASLNFYQSLFFTLLFQELKNYADFETGKKKALPVKVTFLMDEFPSIGRIPGFDKALATFRGRNMDIIMILQNIGQLQKMYPDNEWASIIDCCSTMYLLRTNDIQITAKYISDRSGKQGVIAYMGDEEIGMYDNDTQKRITPRTVYNPDEVIRLKNDEMLIITSGHNIAKVKKHYFFTHPMCKELRDVEINDHIPNWMIDVLKTGEQAEYRRYGIKTQEDIERWTNSLAKEQNAVNTIELCTDDDFKEPWNNKKQKELDIKLTGEINEDHLMRDEEGNELEADATNLANEILSAHYNRQ
jgi:type IV secretion system protein VirD4